MQIKELINKPFMLIIRGLPGSGKSTFAELINQMCHDPLIHAEADKFFEAFCAGKFVPSRIGEAHEWCKQIVECAIENRSNVVVSNTFTREWEYAAYVSMAESADYNVFVVTMNNVHGNQSIHGVPSETMMKMRERFQHKL